MSPKQEIINLPQETYHIKPFQTRTIDSSFQNHVFVVTGTATKSGKMTCKANVATAENHIDDEQIITVICDTGKASVSI